MGGRAAGRGTGYGGLTPLRLKARVRLCEGVVLTVESLELPTEILAIELPDGRIAALVGEVMSVVDPQRPTVLPRFDELAPLRLWTSGVGWRGQVHGSRPFEVRPGLEVRADGILVRFREVARATLASPITARAGLHAPLEVRSTLDELRVGRPGEPPLRVGGLPARLVRELADYQEPVPWQDVAVAILGPDDEIGLRDRWDRTLKALRRKLKEHGLRPDLVRSDGHGAVSLAIEAGDRLEVC